MEGVGKDIENQTRCVLEPDTTRELDSQVIKFFLRHLTLNVVLSHHYGEQRGRGFRKGIVDLLCLNATFDCASCNQQDVVTSIIDLFRLDAFA
jgi:hypothetical protein